MVRRAEILYHFLLSLINWKRKWNWNRARSAALGELLHKIFKLLFISEDASPSAVPLETPGHQLKDFPRCLNLRSASLKSGWFSLYRGAPQASSRVIPSKLETLLSRVDNRPFSFNHSEQRLPEEAVAGPGKRQSQLPSPFAPKWQPFFIRSHYPRPLLGTTNRNKNKTHPPTPYTFR